MMKKQLKRLLALTLSLAMALSLLTACGDTSEGGETSGSNPGTSEAGSEAGGETNEGGGVQVNDDITSEENITGNSYIKDQVNVAFTGATSLSPWGTSNNTPGNYEVYECLFEADVNGVVFPVLADGSKGSEEHPGYDHEEGSNEYTVYIWDYIKDQAGNQITADDVVWSYNYQLENEVTAGWDVIDSIEAVDDTTIKFTFTHELTGLGEFEQVFCYCFIIDEDTWTNSPSNLLSEMIGTGPYKMKEYISGSELILERNEDYWQTNDEYRNQAQAANVQIIDYKFINDTNTRIMNFKTGDLNLSDDFETLNAQELMSDTTVSENFSVYTYPAGLILNLWANCSEESLCNDVNLRKAIFYAIDTDLLIAALGGTDERADTYANDSTTDFYEKWNEADTYNSFHGTAEERQAIVDEYLEAAGYNGEELTFIYQTDMADVCTVLITQLQNAGINVTGSSGDHASVSTTESDPSAWDLEYNKWGGNTYIVLKWAHAFDWANTDGTHTFNYIYDQEWQDLLLEVQTVDGHTEENLTKWLEILYENAYGMNLYNTTKNIIYPNDMTYLYRNNKLIIQPGACEYANPNA